MCQTINERLYTNKIAKFGILCYLKIFSTTQKDCADISKLCCITNLTLKPPFEMVAKAHLDNCTKSVREAIKEAIGLAKLNENNQNDFILFIADAKYQRELEGNVNKLSPYTVNSLDVEYKDVHRREFYVTYINQNAALFYEQIPEEQKATFFRYNTTLEFMIYTHIWESTWFLKSLKQLANLIDGMNYDWHVESKIQNPKQGRGNLIRNDIIKIFAKHELKLANLISNSYHSQIRNAFAHSDFNFGYANQANTINFYNYKGKIGELETISYEDWHTRFAITICLAQYFNEAIDKERKQLGDCSITIAFPDHENGDTLNSLQIRHYNEHDIFNFY